MEDGAEVEDRLGGAGRGVHFFWMNPTSILPSTILPKKGGNFFVFLGGVVGKIRGGIRIGVILWSFLVILFQILSQILPQSYLKSC